jgi:hypothetical protein
LIQAISSNYVNAAKIWRYYFISFVSSGFLFWYFQLLNSPKTVAGKAEPLALPNGRLRNLAWDLFLNQSYFVSILINCLFLIAVLTHTFPYKKANLLWYGVLSTIISFSTLAFQSQFFQTVWNVASFITGPLQGPDRFQYINILTSVLSSALLIHFANLDNASPLVIKFSAVSLAFLVMASMSSINIAYTTKANSLDTKLMTISEIQDELRPPPHFRKGPFQAAIVQYLMVGYSPYNGSKPIKDLPELFFKLNDSNHASTAVSSPGLYKTNLIASPFLRISNAKFEGTDDGDGFAVIRVTENGIVYAEFGF